jgi:hypothetical protein
MWFKSVNSDSSALLYGVFSFLEWSQHFNNNLVKTLPLIPLDHILLVLTTSPNLLHSYFNIRFEKIWL